MRKESQVFDRWELKYVVTIKQMYQLMDALENYVVLDENGNDGLYKIKSIYYDSHDFKFYHEKMNGNKFRQKVRLRGYNNVEKDDNVFFELKQRYNSTVQKRRTGIKLNDAYALMSSDKIDDQKYNDKNLKVLNEIRYLTSMHALEPKAIVSYDRKAYMGKYEEGLRITFDTNLRCRKENLNIEEYNKEKYFVHPSLAVLEIKTNEKVPIWLINMIQRFEIEAHRVSKYCLSVEKLYNL